MLQSFSDLTEKIENTVHKKIVELKLSNKSLHLARVLSKNWGATVCTTTDDWLYSDLSGSRQWACLI